MPAGRPKTPTKLLRINGGFDKRRHSDRDTEPQPEGAAQKLAPLTGEALACWDYYWRRLTALGLATEVDSAELTAMCVWWGEFRNWQSLTGEGVNEYRRIVGMATTYKQFRTIAGKFGLTPQDRTGLTGITRTTDDELSELIA